jgi:hypothetical protein
MLTIQPAQLEAFERILSERMHEMVESAIATAFPEACAVPGADGKGDKRRCANEQGRRIVARGIESAANFGIDSDADLAAFIVLGLALRSNGSSRAVPQWIVAWLNRPDTPGATKMAIIEAQLAEFGATDPELRAVSDKIASARRCVNEWSRA